MVTNKGVTMEYKNKIRSFLCAVSLLTIGIVTKQNVSAMNDKKEEEEIVAIKKPEITLVSFVAKPFDFSPKKTTFSQSQLEQHHQLYKGYIKKRNEIEQKLSNVDTTD